VCSFAGYPAAPAQASRFGGAVTGRERPWQCLRTRSTLPAV
jgi:hypothetical protein